VRVTRQRRGVMRVRVRRARGRVCRCARLRALPRRTGQPASRVVTGATRLACAAKTQRARACTRLSPGAAAAAIPGGTRSMGRLWRRVAGHARSARNSGPAPRAAPRATSAHTHMSRLNSNSVHVNVRAHLPFRACDRPAVRRGAGRRRPAAAGTQGNGRNCVRRARKVAVAAPQRAGAAAVPLCARGKKNRACFLLLVCASANAASPRRGRFEPRHFPPPARAPGCAPRSCGTAAARQRRRAGPWHAHAAKKVFSALYSDFRRHLRKVVPPCFVSAGCCQRAILTPPKGRHHAAFVPRFEARAVPRQVLIRCRI
jgi:hypothetical protein